MKRLVFALGLCFLLAGCGNAVEISERDMVVVMGVDKEYTGMVKATTGSAVLAGSEGGKGKLNVRSAEGESLPGALEVNSRADALSPFYGQLKTVVLGEGVLDDEAMLESVVEVLLKNNDINMRTIVTGCRGKAEDILKATAKKENEYGLYIWDYYKNAGKNNGDTFKMTVNELAMEIGGGYILPMCEMQEDDIKIGGGFVMEGFELRGELEGDDMLGAMLIKGDIREAVISTGDKAAKIKSSKKRISFEDTDKNTLCRIDIFIKVQPLTEEFDIKTAEDRIEKNVTDMLLKVYGGYETDALGLFGGKYRQAEFKVNVFMAVE